MAKTQKPPVTGTFRDLAKTVSQGVPAPNPAPTPAPNLSQAVAETPAKLTPQMRAVKAVGRGVGAVGRGVMKAGEWAGTAQGQQTLGQIAAGFSMEGSTASRMGQQAIERGQSMRFGEELAKYDEEGKLIAGQKLNLADLTADQQRMLLTMQENASGRRAEAAIAERNAGVQERGQDINRLISQFEIDSRDFNAEQDRLSREGMTEEELAERQRQFDEEIKFRRDELAQRARELRAQANQQRTTFSPALANTVDKEAGIMFYNKIMNSLSDPRYAALREAVNATKDPATGGVDLIRLFGAASSNDALSAQLQSARSTMYTLLQVNPNMAPSEAARLAAESINFGQAQPTAPTGTTGQGTGSAQSSRTRGAGQSTVPSFTSSAQLGQAIKAGTVKEGDTIVYQGSRRTVTAQTIDLYN